MIRIGNCIDLMSEMADNSIDAVVTDPPYELGFMGKSWDASGIAYNTEVWRQCLRILKPGGHLLAFGGSRTYHRLACAIEDAGFDIRDQIMWVYGSGFPKSMNIGKAIDKASGATRTVVGVGKSGKNRNVLNAANYPDTFGGDYEITEAATQEAKQWEGWGTALKPAHEPIVVARKAVDGTIAQNVMTWGTGGINIDGCRVRREDGDDSVAGSRTATFGTQETVSGGNGTGGWEQNDAGRFPANFIHDGSDEVLQLFPNSKAGKPQEKRGTGGIWGKGDGHSIPVGPSYGDDGSAARFFYCAKPSTAERNAGLDGLQKKKADTRSDVAAGMWKDKNAAHQNHHPTVKPITLMRYLIKLVVPPNGIVLDPFLGSGTTGVAAIQENINWLGFEMNPEYADIARRRTGHASF
jgi:site-specific DNA-methyltransferase (adenine-specific)